MIYTDRNICIVLNGSFQGSSAGCISAPVSIKKKNKVENRWMPSDIMFITGRNKTLFFGMNISGTLPFYFNHWLPGRYTAYLPPPVKNKARPQHKNNRFSSPDSPPVLVRVKASVDFAK